MIRIGVIGYGYWGPQVVRNFAHSERFQLAAICDQSPSRLELARQSHPHVPLTSNAASLVDDPTIDAVAVVTPVATHYELALAALRACKHVWVEKPLTASSEEAKRLRDESERQGKVLLVDHTFVYTSAVRKVRELLQAGAIGQVWNYDSVRANLGRFSPDANVLWDLACHDLSIINYVLSPRYEAVSAAGTAQVNGAREHTAHLILYLSGGAMAHVHVDWLSPIKIRRTMITGSEKMMVYDDNEPVEKVRVYDSGIDATPVEGSPPKIAYRQGKLTAPKLPTEEALRVAVNHFADCIEQGRRPITDGEFGVSLIRVLEAACASLQDRGKLVTL
jgi:predicted dehydrogenase